MKPTALVPAFALVVALAASAGGPACGISWGSAVQTPGIQELAMGSSKEPLPSGVRLTQAQIQKLFDVSEEIRRDRRALDGRLEKLRWRKDVPVAAGEGAKLPGLVQAFLARATRDTALLIDPETSGLFDLARSKAVAAFERGEADPEACPICIAVRRGIEAPFAFGAEEFDGALTADEKKEAEAIAAGRQELRLKWIRAIRAELTEAQLDWLRHTQERWLVEETGRVVTAGLRAAGSETCRTCAEEPVTPAKCKFCSVADRAAKEAARQ